MDGNEDLSVLFIGDPILIMITTNFPFLYDNVQKNIYLKSSQNRGMNMGKNIGTDVGVCHSRLCCATPDCTVPLQTVLCHSRLCCATPD